MSDTKFTLLSLQEEKQTVRLFNLSFTENEFKRRVTVNFSTRNNEVDEMTVRVYDGAHGMVIGKFYYPNPKFGKDDAEEERYRKMCLEVTELTTTTLFLSEGI